MKERIKLYSVTMTEEELRLFSEFLGQKEFEDTEYIMKKVRKYPFFT